MTKIKQLAKSVCKATLLGGMVLATTMSFAQNIQKAGSGTSLSLEKGGKKIVNETFEKIVGYNDKAGLIPAKLNGKWGFYNNDGKLVIPHQYSLLFFGDPNYWYAGGLIQVELNGKKIWIDKTGKESADYEKFADLNVDGREPYFYFAIKDKNGNWALANEEKILTPFEYIMFQQGSKNPVTFNAVRASDSKVLKLDINGQEAGTIKYNTYVCGFCGKKQDSNVEPTATKGCKHTLSNGHHKWEKQ